MRNFSTLFLSCLVVQGLSFGQTVSGLVGSWKLDEGAGTTAADSSGYGHSGTIYGARWAAGKVGSALDFTNSQGLVTVSGSFSLNSLSLELWALPRANSGNASVMMNYGNSGFDLRISEQGFLSGTVGGVTLTDQSFNFYSSANAGKWYHLVYTFDPAARQHYLYRNGGLVAHGAISAKFQPNADFWIGRNAQWDFGTFQGSLDYVRVYNRVLQTSEVANHYQTEGGGAPAPAPTKPAITSFTTNPSSVLTGQSATLSWVTSGATSVSIAPAPGTVSGASGSASVTPAQTTAYTLTATNAAGSTTASVTVTVTADTTAPTTPTNLTATAGSSSTVALSWAASSDNISVSGYKISRNGAQIGTSAATSYTDTGLSAGTTYSYAIAAYDSAGNTSAPASVSVQTQAAPVPVITSFSASPASITAGGSATLSWSVTGSTSLSISPSPGAVTGGTGSVSVTPTATTTYTLTATNSAGSATQSATVTVTAPAPTQPPAPVTTGNGITITDLSGAGQTARPFSISRVFVQGEFPAGSYPQARVGGTPVLTQVDVKNTWSDGSLRHAIVSFAASVPASGNLSVDFVTQSTTNNTGSLDKTGMLNYNNGAWGADIEVTNGNTLKADARAMLTAWSGSDTGLNGLGVRYWLKGPVVTQVIVEDRSANLAFDMGWDSFRPLHPIFVLSFYPGSGLGVKVEYILENAWTTKLEDQNYSLVLKAGSSLNAMVYSKGSFTHAAATRWRKTFWSGAAPSGWTDAGRPGVNINYNPAYLTASKAIPNFDLSKTVASSVIADDVNGFKASDRGDINGYAMWLQYMPQTGGRPDIGLIPAWYVRYLYSMDPGMYSMLVGMGEVSGYVPFHFRESASGKMYDSGRTVSAFGRPLSIDARPTVYVTNFSYSGVSAGDMISPVGPMSTNGWTVDIAHQPAFSYIPYLITGDWYFLEELYFQGARDLAAGAPGVDTWNRHDSWGWFNDADVQTRGQAWGRRDIAEAGFAAPDGSAEKAYFTEKVNNNLAIEEGYLNTTTGMFYQACTTNYDPSSETSKWCWGRRSAAWGSPNPLHFGAMGGSYDTFILDSDLVPQSDPNAPSQADRPWMTLYKLNVAGHIQELGYPAKGANGTAFLSLVNILANPSFNPYLCGAYTMATFTKANTFYQDWGTLLQSFTTNWNGVNLRTVNKWWDTSSDDNSADGYPHICQAAASYLPGLSEGSVTGTAAWNWTLTHINPAPLSENPQYAILPR